MSTEEMVAWGFLAYLLLALAYSSNYSRKIKKWPFVVGTLLKAEVEIINALDMGSAYELVEYEYEVDGVRFVGNRLSPLVFRGQVRRLINKQLAKIHYVSGNQVKVFYNDKDPRKSFLVIETWLDLIF